MSSNCKIVKGISLLMLVFGIVSVATGIFMFATAPAASGVEDPVITAEVLGALLAVFGVVYFAAGVAGARGANNPSTLGVFIALGTVVAVANLVEVALSVNMGSAVWQNLLFAAVAFVGVVYASRAKKEARF